MKIAYQGVAGSYSESCAKENYPNCETIPCKTFDECFELANNESSVKAIIPESNKTTGNIGVEYLIFKYRLNIFAEHFFPINHNLLALPGSKIEDIKEIHSHTAALSQTSSFIRKYNLKEVVMADTAGSAAYIASIKDKSKSAIASKLSAEIYGLEIIKSDIQDDKENYTRFLVFQKDIAQPEFKKDGKYITSFLFKLKNKPAALFQSLTGLSLRQVDMTKLQSFPEKGTFLSYYFFCEVQGHISEEKVAGALSDLEIHCAEFQLLGVFEQDVFRQK